MTKKIRIRYLIEQERKKKILTFGLSHKKLRKYFVGTHVVNHSFVDNYSSSRPSDCHGDNLLVLPKLDTTFLCRKLNLDLELVLCAVYTMEVSHKHTIISSVSPLPLHRPQLLRHFVNMFSGNF